MDTDGIRYPLEKPLSDILGHVYGIQLPGDFLSTTAHLAPDLEMMVVLNFAAPLTYNFGNESKKRIIDRIAVVGPLRQMMNYQLDAGADLLVLPFIHDGFYRFFKLPVDKLLAGEIESENLERQMLLLEDLWLILSAFADMDQRVRFLKYWLLGHIFPSTVATEDLLTGITAIHDPNLNPVAIMAGNAALSERTIQLRFKKYTGYSPKELLRFLRFKQVIHYLNTQSDAKVDWFELILKFRYHDQSHLIKDFKYYTGITPKNFLKLQSSGSFCIGRD
jgi:AraC-like DNA-binding protein